MKPAVNYSFAEELVNSISHGIGALLSVVGLVVLIVSAVMHGTVWHVVSFTIFGSTLIILYFASTLYHSLPNPSWKTFLKKLDHAAIFLLIAGSYTPFMLVNLRGPWGWSIFGVIWGLALAGVILKMFFVHKFSRLSTVIYVFMGWLCVIAFKQMLLYVPETSLILLIAGGLAYTTGVIFYAWKKLPFNHAIWHGFVLGGSVLHFFSILNIV